VVTSVGVVGAGKRTISCCIIPMNWYDTIVSVPLKSYGA
jgi:hypothetical protein